MRTRTLDEAIDAVSKLYCPHTLALTGRVRNTDAVPKVHHSASSQPLVELSSGAPVNIDAENFPRLLDRKSTRLNSSHLGISYAVFCLKKKSGYRAYKSRLQVRLQPLQQEV